MFFNKKNNTTTKKDKYKEFEKFLLDSEEFEKTFDFLDSVCLTNQRLIFRQVDFP